MATNEAPALGRQLALQVVHTFRRTIGFAEASGHVGILPSNAIVVKGTVYVHTAFNDTTGDDLDVGIVGGDVDLFASAIDLNTPAIIAFDDLAIANVMSTAERVITWSYTTAKTGDGATGSATIVVEFVVANDAP